MKAPLFRELYHVSIPSLSIALREGNPCVQKIGTRVEVDEKGLLARRRFRLRVQQKSIDNYYSIREVINDFTLAKQLHYMHTDISVRSWNTYIGRNLFDNPDHISILRYKTPKKMWLFYKLTQRLLKETL